MGGRVILYNENYCNQKTIYHEEYIQELSGKISSQCKQWDQQTILHVQETGFYFRGKNQLFP